MWVHGGHGSLGMQAAPATAAWLAAAMHGEAVAADVRGTTTGAIHMISQRVGSMLRMTMADMADAADDADGAFRLENADTCLTPPSHVLKATREAVGVEPEDRLREAGRRIARFSASG